MQERGKTIKSAFISANLVVHMHRVMVASLAGTIGPRISKTVLDPSNPNYDFREAHILYSGKLSELPRLHRQETGWIKEKEWMILYNLRKDQRFRGYERLEAIPNTPENYALMGKFGDHCGEGGWDAMVRAADFHQAPHIFREPVRIDARNIEHLLQVDALRSAGVLSLQEGPIPVEVRDPRWLPAINLLKRHYRGTQEYRRN